jgi:hypothetical protein
MFIYRLAAALRVGPVGIGPASHRLIGLAAAYPPHPVNWCIPCATPVELDRLSMGLRGESGDREIGLRKRADQLRRIMVRYRGINVGYGNHPGET